MSDFICSIPVLASFFAACTGIPPLATGYVEGEFRLIAPIATAQVGSLNVARGSRIAAGDVLAVMETRDAEIAVAEATAAMENAESNLANLRQGRRAEEISVIEATLASARADAVEAERQAERQAGLLLRGITPQAEADDAQTRLDMARARVAEVEANLAVAKLPARPHEIEAAVAAVARAGAQKDAAIWQLQQRTLTAPANGRIYEVLRDPGEIAGPQAPVLSMLPDGAVLLRLYVPEHDVARIVPGTVLRVDCDACPDGQTATVTYVSDEPEFTPPVIYSLETRQKLVYLIEARPDAGSERLKPGQIVDVRPESEP
ncbi:HlyD family secretion protein [Tropicimonas sp.]|uniref:HlyD family secretion protein n=1 Tax=Tropicimonas sp. TaxID=2067044 RepID=UPI003A8A82C1